MNSCFVKEKFTFEGWTVSNELNVIKVFSVFLLFFCYIFKLVIDLHKLFLLIKLFLFLRIASKLDIDLDDF